MNKYFMYQVLSIPFYYFPSLVISYISMRMFEKDWSFFLWTFLGIQIFFIIQWFFKNIATFVSYHLIWKGPIVNELYSHLIRFKYPPCQLYYIFDVETYFEDIVTNSHPPEDIYTAEDAIDAVKGYPCEMRINATSHQQMLKNIENNLLMLYSWLVKRTYKSVINQYTEACWTKEESKEKSGDKQ